MRTARRQLPQLAAVALAALAVLQPAHALDYPTRTVRLVVGFPPGGSADIVARLVAQALTERMGQTFIIDNKPGAGSNLGTETVARAEPDGYTLMAESVSNAINPTLYKKLNYDQLRDLVPVASIDVVPNVMTSTWTCRPGPFRSSLPTPRPIPARSAWARAASARRRMWPASCSR